MATDNDELSALMGELGIPPPAGGAPAPAPTEGTPPPLPAKRNRPTSVAVNQQNGGAAAGAGGAPARAPGPAGPAGAGAGGAAPPPAAATGPAQPSLTPNAAAEVESMFDDLIGGGPQNSAPQAPAGAPGAPVATCALCKEPIMGPCINALQKSWHIDHFACAECLNPFPGGQFLEFEGKAYCQTDYTELFGHVCAICKTPFLGKPTVVNGRPVCQRDAANPAAMLALQNSGPGGLRGPAGAPPANLASAAAPQAPGVGGQAPGVGAPAAGAVVCAVCRGAIVGRCVNALGRSFHPEHFVCTQCKQPFPGNFYEKDGRPYCEKDYKALFTAICAKCGQTITGRGVNALNKLWHAEHFTCTGCEKSLAGAAFCEHDGRPMCRECFMRLPKHLQQKVKASATGR